MYPADGLVSATFHLHMRKASVEGSIESVSLWLLLVTSNYVEPLFEGNRSLVVAREWP